MPLYEAVCRHCGKYEPYYRKLERYLDTPQCCNEPMQKVIHHPPMAIPEITPYQSPITGSWVDSRQQRREDFARNQCRPWEGIEQERKEASRRVQYENQAMNQRIFKAVENDLREMPINKKANLLY